MLNDWKSAQKVEDRVLTFKLKDNLVMTDFLVDEGYDRSKSHQ